MRGERDEEFKVECGAKGREGKGSSAMAIVVATRTAGSSRLGPLSEPPWQRGVHFRLSRITSASRGIMACSDTTSFIFQSVQYSDSSEFRGSDHALVASLLLVACAYLQAACGHQQRQLYLTQYPD